MKPLSQITVQRRSYLGEESRVDLRSIHPLTDFQFHAPTGEIRGTKLSPPKVAPSFRHLSSEFIATEMKRDYVAEASLFAIMVGISAWPMTLMIQAMGQLGK